MRGTLNVRMKTVLLRCRTVRFIEFLVRTSLVISDCAATRRSLGYRRDDADHVPDAPRNDIGVQRAPGGAHTIL